MTASNEPGSMPPLAVEGDAEGGEKGARASPEPSGKDAPYRSLTRVAPPVKNGGREELAYLSANAVAASFAAGSSQIRAIRTPGKAKAAQA